MEVDETFALFLFLKGGIAMNIELHAVRYNPNVAGDAITIKINCDKDEYAAAMKLIDKFKNS